MIAGLIKRAQIVGVGLIGGSIAKGLRDSGWHVTVTDTDTESVETALELGVADVSGFDSEASIVFIATPVSLIASQAREALARCEAVVTDVGSAKRTICEQVSNERFVGGHPMAGSEMAGVSGARGDLFNGATWFITPEASTSDASVTLVFNVVGELGANPIALDPVAHDSLVAKISHIPYLASVGLMNQAMESDFDQELLLKAAAGGFRDMTRIAGGNVAIWPDIVDANSNAVSTGLRSLASSLTSMADDIENGNTRGVRESLSKAKHGRAAIAERSGVENDLNSVEFAIEDKPGQLAMITKLAASENINLFDISITHSTNLKSGRIAVLVSERQSELFSDKLTELGFAPIIVRF